MLSGFRYFVGTKAVVLSAWVLTAGAAAAGGLSVAPVSLEFGPGDSGQKIWLSNPGTEPIRAQVRVQEWTQLNGVDRLAPTRDLVASPPFVELSSGEKQLVRIVRIEVASHAVERAFRLIIDELPGVESLSSDSSFVPHNGEGLQFQLRYSVPVFVSSSRLKEPNGKPSDLSAIAAVLRVGGQFPVLQITNDGDRRLRISQLTHIDLKGKRTTLAAGLLGYVLGKQKMEWVLKNMPLSLVGSGVIKAKFNADLEEQTLPVLASRS